MNEVNETKPTVVMSAAEFFEKAKVQKRFVKLVGDKGFWVHGLSSDERDHYEMEVLTDQGKPRNEQLRAGLVAVCTRDENGIRIFNDKEDVLKLGKSAATYVQKLFSAAQKLSGMTAQDMEDLQGN